MNMQERQPHEPLDIPIQGGHRYTCALCGAAVSVPTDLLIQWNREGKLMDEIQVRLTRSLLLKTGHLTGRPRS